ncbi:MAG: rod shape-determining protein MreD [Bacteroidales bacterium]
MNNLYFRNILRFLLLILLQVLVFDNMEIRGYINPYIYVLFILLIPFETPPWLLLISAFLLGFGVDLFSDTMGMHTAASVFMAFCRPGILRFVFSSKDYEIGITPGISDLGIEWFLKYSLILVFLHHLVFFYLEVFTFHEFFYTFARVILSTLTTVLFIVIGQYLFYIKK